MQNIDYFIVGGGIAGITLGLHLAEQGLTFHLYEEGGRSSSRVAAGLFNPITGRKMVKTWKADDLFPYLHSFYTRMEHLTGGKFYHPTSLYRPFISVEEQNDWIGKSTDPAYSPYIKKVHTKSRFSGKFNDPFGGISLNHSGWVDTSQYITSAFKYFQSIPEQVKVISKKIEAELVQINENTVSYEQARAKRLVFCDGTALTENEYFNWLPMQPLKGEILEIKLPFATDEVFNRGIFILPLGRNIYKVGSTYDHNDNDWQVTEAGKQQLVSKLKGLVQTDFEITSHDAGIRPSTKDRRPLLGKHPVYKNLLVFNGLGTKGVSLAPYFANQLLKFAEEDVMPDKEVNIQRFFSLYSHKRRNI